MVLTVFFLTALLARFFISSLEITENLAIIFFLKQKPKLIVFNFVLVTLL